MSRDQPAVLGFGQRKRGAAVTTRRSLAINAVCNWLAFAVSAALAFVTSPILVAGLGTERYGVWSLVEALVGWFALLDMGIGASVVRYVAKFEAADDRAKLNQVFSTTLFIFAAAGALAVLSCTILALVWRQPLDLPDELALTTRWLIVLLGTNVALELVVGVYGAVLYGLARFPARTAIDITLRVAGALALIGVIRGGGGLIALALVALTATGLKGMVRYMTVRYYLPSLRFAPMMVNGQIFHTIKGYSTRAFAIMLAGQISHNLDAIVIGTLLAPRNVTYFVIAARLVSYAKDAVSSLSAVLTPAVSALQSRNEWNAIRRAFIDGTRYVMWLAIPIQLGLIFFGEPFLRLWVGADVADAAYPVLVLLSVPLFVSLPMIVGSRILYGLGELRWMAVWSMLAAVSNLLISVLLVRRYGINGVAFGTTVTVLAYAIAVITLTCRHLGQGVAAYTGQITLPVILPTFLLLVVWMHIRTILAPESWGTLIAATILGLAPYAAAALITEMLAACRIRNAAVQVSARHRSDAL